MSSPSNPPPSSRALPDEFVDVSQPPAPRTAKPHFRLPLAEASGTNTVVRATDSSPAAAALPEARVDVEQHHLAATIEEFAAAASDLEPPAYLSEAPPPSEADFFEAASAAVARDYDEISIARSSTLQTEDSAGAAVGVEMSEHGASAAQVEVVEVFDGKGHEIFSNRELTESEQEGVAAIVEAYGDVLAADETLAREARAEELAHQPADPGYFGVIETPYPVEGNPTAAPLEEERPLIVSFLGESAPSANEQNELAKFFPMDAQAVLAESNGAVVGEGSDAQATLTDASSSTASSEPQNLEGFSAAVVGDDGIGLPDEVEMGANAAPLPESPEHQGQSPLEPNSVPMGAGADQAHAVEREASEPSGAELAPPPRASVAQAPAFTKGERDQQKKSNPSPMPAPQAQLGELDPLSRLANGIINLGVGAAVAGTSFLTSTLKVAPTIRDRMVLRQEEGLRRSRTEFLAQAAAFDESLDTLKAPASARARDFQMRALAIQTQGVRLALDDYLGRIGGMKDPTQRAAASLEAEERVSLLNTNFANTKIPEDQLDPEAGAKLKQSIDGIIRALQRMFSAFKGSRATSRLAAESAPSEQSLSM